MLKAADEPLTLVRLQWMEKKFNSQVMKKGILDGV